MTDKSFRLLRGDLPASRQGKADSRLWRESKKAFLLSKKRLLCFSVAKQNFDVRLGEEGVRDPWRDYRGAGARVGRTGFVWFVPT